MKLLWDRDVTVRAQLRAKQNACLLSSLNIIAPHKQMPAVTTIPIAPGGIKSYYQAKIESAEILINQKTQNLRRLEAQRNALNARGQYITVKRLFKQRKS